MSPEMPPSLADMFSQAQAMGSGVPAAVTEVWFRDGWLHPRGRTELSPLTHTPLPHFSTRLLPGDLTA